MKDGDKFLQNGGRWTSEHCFSRTEKACTLDFRGSQDPHPGESLKARGEGRVQGGEIAT